ncbi:MAG TPA: S41 family peptidase [Lachnospiraceae bacterium]|nr:S41 family peptidase [Lachnospiraceae bacterium]
MNDTNNQTNNSNKTLVIGLLIGLVTGICLSIFAWSIYTMTKPRTSAGLSYISNESGTVSWNAVEDKLTQMQRVIDAYYKNEYSEEDLVEGLYAGYMSGLGDPYSVYYTKEEFGEMLESSSGIYYGVGAYLNQDAETGMVRILRPIKGTPAEEAGIKSGDLIVEVDGEDVSKEDTTLVSSKIRGPEGTEVEIKMKREGESELLTFHLVRTEIETPTIEYEMKEDHIGYLSILEFDDITLPQFEEAINALTAEGMESLILDLRGNPGGNLDTVVKIADLLLPKGLVVYTEDKNGARTEFTSDASQVVEMPLVVLIDGNSASAAEILAGSIQDYKIGTLLGTTTYGKGVVQQVIPLGDGTGVKVTISKYFTPNGNDIDGIGIEPDVELEFDMDAYEQDETADNQLDKAIEMLKK